MLLLAEGVRRNQDENANEAAAEGHNMHDANQDKDRPAVGQKIVQMSEAHDRTAECGNMLGVLQGPTACSPIAQICTWPSWSSRSASR